MTAAQDWPRWRTDNIYAGLETDDFRQSVETLQQELTALETLMDQRQIRRLSAAPPAPFAEGGETLVALLQAFNSIALRIETLDAFLYAFVSTDSYNTVASRESSRLDLFQTRRQKLGVRLQGWIGSVAAHLDDWIGTHPLLAEHRAFLKEAARQSQFLMSEELEGLAADLCLDGALAFGKLQGNVTSQLKVPFEQNGRTELLPITMVRNLSYDPDPTVRERAYRAELAGWESVRTAVAASLNSVKGTALTLAQRRGRKQVLDVALDDNRIDETTLRAMLGAIQDRIPMFQRYLKAKAQRLGLPRLRWWDLFAPLGSVHRTFTWEQATRLVIEKFSTFSAELGDYAAQAFREHWVDVGPRDGKRGGAFCMAVVGVEESRILMNFDGSFEQVSTLAHELGHGFHNHCQKGLPPLRRGAPSTLAETASIFCETLLAESLLAEMTPSEQLPILEAQLCGATQVCLDIRSRFLFESAVFERRQASELSPDDFCELMLAAQSQNYGDAVDPKTYHPYMWLWKPHYYAYSANFYNFPYAFGHLFSLGLYAQFRREGAAFLPKYTALLRSTGEEDAAPLARRFGIEIQSASFWHDSLDMIERQVERFEQLPQA